MKPIFNRKHLKSKNLKASFTVEASLVLPLFLFFFLSLLYFLQIITLQEQLQKAITDTGLSMARAAYFYSDFQQEEDIESADTSILEEEIRSDLEDLKNAIINNVVLKYIVTSRLDTDYIINSIIVGGLNGISFDESSLLKNNDDIDIILKYRIRIPLSIFGLNDMDMIQRVRLRGWNGHQLDPLYSYVQEEEEGDETIVYITETGRVYHLKRTCSHINLTIETIIGKPTWQRNQNGGKYYPCEACCKGNVSEFGTYYITPTGDRYHTKKDCSKIKRTVKEVPLSEVSGWPLCKRCEKQSLR